MTLNPGDEKLPPYEEPLPGSAVYNVHTPCPRPRANLSLSSERHRLPCEPASVTFQDVFPTDTELPPIQIPSGRHAFAHPALPPLSAVTGSVSAHRAQPQTFSSTPPAPVAKSIPNLNPLSVYYTPHHVSMEPAQTARLETSIDMASPQGGVSLEDPDVRMAAEALGDLRADWSSPATVSLPPPSPPTELVVPPRQAGQTSHPMDEPLLTLLTTAYPGLHPYVEKVEKTVGLADTIYTSSKNYLPRFKSNAERIEGYLEPLASTVGSIGRVTGMGGCLRRHLVASRRVSQLNGNRKRRRCHSNDGDIEMDCADMPLAKKDLYGSRDRRTSMSTIDSLPDYEDFQSPPAYNESPGSHESRPESPRSNVRRVLAATSGLGIAMRAESMKKLTFCVGWLQQGTERLVNIIQMLKESCRVYLERQQRGDGDGTSDAGDSEQLTEQIASLREEVVSILRSTTEAVSRNTGGVLPQNVAVFVRVHLTSLPGRWYHAVRLGSRVRPSDDTHADTQTYDAAQGVIVLAQEGLKMFEQVTTALDVTLKSAEEWCAKRSRSRSQPETPTDLDKVCISRDEMGPDPAPTGDDMHPST